MVLWFHVSLVFVLADIPHLMLSSNLPAAPFQGYPLLYLIAKSLFARLIMNSKEHGLHMQGGVPYLA